MYTSNFKPLDDLNLNLANFLQLFASISRITSVICIYFLHLTSQVKVELDIARYISIYEPVFVPVHKNNAFPL